MPACQQCSQGLCGRKVARPGVEEGVIDEINRLLQRHQETGHQRLGQRQRLTGLQLLDEQRITEPREYITLP